MVNVRDKTAEDIPALWEKAETTKDTKVHEGKSGISSCDFVSFVVDWSERRFPCAIFSGTKVASGASDGHGGIIMSKLAIWAQLEAKPGKEKELEEFLKSAEPLAEREPGTLTWYAIKMGPGKYGIFDTFADENGRNAHLNGDIAKALFAKAKDLLAQPPKIDKPEILASKAAR
jgi:quinol monooxygenase YgiN